MALRLALLALTSPSLAGAASFFSNTTVPTNLSPGCAAALTADVVGCSRAVAALQHGNFYPKSSLESICTSNCASSLASYHSAVLSACAADTWEGFGREPEPVAGISEIVRYHYNVTCLSDGTRFCNNVAASFAAYSDPESAGRPGGLPAGGDFGGLQITDPCDPCLVDSLRFVAGSPYYDGPKLRASSVYESKTSSCGITGAPLTTTSLSIFT